MMSGCNLKIQNDLLRIRDSGFGIRVDFKRRLKTLLITAYINSNPKSEGLKDPSVRILCPSLVV